MNEYEVLKNRQQKEVNDFPMFFAFSDKQFAEGMAKFGLNPDQTDKIYKFGNTGGFYLRSYSQKLRDMLDRHDLERKEAIDADATGDGYIFQMFLYELRNHEYGYTWDAEPALEALGLTLEEVMADKKLLHGYNRAIALARKDDD